ncbi:hypothetical protein [Galbibacter pacificus]|uniref:Uncharacterized protein n=1 Tax=Galbibacter pacificus TaxID=2996052 RepID=A0ABT6FQV5_9FLAO|nr:hypothetical protein [Galbibacter pacificus]MDG3582040.1 hypothetical protein [Galbibacter pacificus]MDG3585486.1 hypothetical protein [Galbibacter pacificus]
MDYSEFSSNVNFFSLLCKIKALKSVLSEEQQAKYHKNLLNIVEENIDTIEEEIPKNKRKTFRAVVMATLEN